MRAPNRERQPYPLLALANELLELLADAREQIAGIKSELERQQVPALRPASPVFVRDDPTLEVELHERITAVGVLCAQAYGYRYKTRRGFPQVAARLRADLGIQRLSDMRVDHWSQAVTALRRIEHDARQRIVQLSTDRDNPANSTEEAVRADLAGMRDAVGRAAQEDPGRPSAGPCAGPTSTRDVP